MKKVLPWLAGLLTGFLGGLLGGGGGLVAVPLLRVCGLEGKEVHATSLAVTLSLSCLSAWLYLRAGRLDLMSAAPYLPGGLAGALAGALLLRKANPRLLRLLFAGLLLLSAGGCSWDRVKAWGSLLPGKLPGPFGGLPSRPERATGEERRRKMERIWQTAAAFGAGALGAMGLGGGSLLLLYLTLAAGVEQLEAQGINLLFFLPTGLLAVSLHSHSRLIRWKIALPAIAAGLAGSLAGSWGAGLLPQEWLRRLFGGLVLALGVRELWAARKQPGGPPPPVG